MSTSITFFKHLKDPPVFSRINDVINGIAFNIPVRDNAPEASTGAIYYDTVTDELGIHNGSDWRTIGPSVISSNFISAFDTTDQSGSITPGTFTTITFDTIAQLAGWTHDAGVFTCDQTGLYMVTYSANASCALASTISIVATLNGKIEGIPGSIGCAMMSVADIPKLVTQVFMSSFTRGDKFELQFTGSADDIPHLVPIGTVISPAVASSVTLNVVRLT